MESHAFLTGFRAIGGSGDDSALDLAFALDKTTRLYGDASLERRRAIADRWRPYRSWVSVLIRSAA